MDKFSAMREGGKKLAQIKLKLAEYTQKTLSMEGIEAKASELILKSGGQGSFKMVPGYRWNTCININSGVVHGIPKGKIKKGDLVTIDVGLFYKGYHTDTAVSFVVGESDSKQQRFLETGKRVLNQAIKVIKPGRKIYDISRTIQSGIEKAGYSVVRELTGHGVGEELHEEPAVPCFVSQEREMDIALLEGMTLAIEVMYTAGNWPLILDDDGWTLKTKDNSLAAVFEESVYITKDGSMVLTN